MPGDPVALRQCLLSLFAVVIPRAAGGSVEFGAQQQGVQVALWLRCAAYPSGPKPALGDEAAGLNMAVELARLCGGRLDLDADARAFDARLWLPALAQSPVLVIDDHGDALQLLERYTLGTRYSFIGSRDPAQALPLAAQHAPCAIVLDVMMPNVDDWEVLGRLKRDPATAHIPVIVCTIMAQKEFARLLGAAAFLRKPVSRQAFLAALDEVLRGTEETDGTMGTEGAKGTAGSSARPSPTA
ncbi:MAG: response regulator [Anaerolineae bacterium]